MLTINKRFGVLSRSSFLHLSCENLRYFSRQLLRVPYLSTRQLLGNINRILRNPLYPAAGPTRLYSNSVSIPSFSYRIGVAFSAKNTRFNPNTDLFSFDSKKEVKKINTGRPRSGQDAFFVSNVAYGNNVAFGVADGVGGWIESGIDSAHFSHGLCKYMAESARGIKGTNNKIKAGAVLQEGYEGVVEDTSIAGGGSTACVAIASSDGHIEVAK
jgi:protein phosphatase PTC7